jgi:ubiquinone/menaquinone biosynthesis C-methylase UbiE
MRPMPRFLRLLTIFLGLLLAGDACSFAGRAQDPPPTRPATRSAAEGYETLERPSRDGIGKAYMGREIAQVMGHLAAGWLERPEREAEEKPRLLIDNLKLEADDVVADIGAGTGYFTFRLAQRLPEGKVLAVDIQQEMLDMLSARELELGLTNVEPILGDVDDPKLPAGSVDLVLMVDAYHEFDHPREMMAGIMAGLKPGGRVALVEYRGEDPSVPIKPLHKMTERQARREMTAAGLEHAETINVLPLQHLMIFRKPAEPG